MLTNLDQRGAVSRAAPPGRGGPGARVGVLAGGAALACKALGLRRLRGQWAGKGCLAVGGAGGAEWAQYHKWVHSWPRGAPHTSCTCGGRAC